MYHLSKFIQLFVCTLLLIHPAYGVIKTTVVLQTGVCMTGYGTSKVGRPIPRTTYRDVTHSHVTTTNTNTPSTTVTPTTTTTITSTVTSTVSVTADTTTDTSTVTNTIVSTETDTASTTTTIISTVTSTSTTLSYTATSSEPAGFTPIQLEPTIVRSGGGMAKRADNHVAGHDARGIAGNKLLGHPALVNGLQVMVAGTSTAYPTTVVCSTSVTSITTTIYSTTGPVTTITAPTVTVSITTMSTTSTTSTITPADATTTITTEVSSVTTTTTTSTYTTSSTTTAITTVPTDVTYYSVCEDSQNYISHVNGSIITGLYYHSSELTYYNIHGITTSHDCCVSCAQLSTCVISHYFIDYDQCAIFSPVNGTAPMCNVESYVPVFVVTGSGGYNASNSNSYCAQVGYNAYSTT